MRKHNNLPTAPRRRPSRLSWAIHVLGGYALFVVWRLFPRIFRLHLVPLFIILSLLKA